jgi:serine/threonine protein phosphatase 1
MRTLAIGDIHGCLAALDDLLAAVAPQPDDLLVFLGDYVDRGPDSRGVLDRLIELCRTHRVVPLRGNHEMMMRYARRTTASP